MPHLFNFKKKVTHMSNTEHEQKAVSPIMRVGHGLTKWIDRIESFILATSIGLLAVLLIVNVIARNARQSIYFADELSKLLIIFTTFIGTSYAARKARHIRMGAIIELLPKKVEKVVVIFVSLISAVTMFILAIYAFRYMEQLRVRGTKTPALGNPYWLYIIIAPVGLFLASIQFFRTVIKNFVEKDVWLSPEQQSEFEEEEAMMDKIRAEADEYVKRVEVKEGE